MDKQRISQECVFSALIVAALVGVPVESAHAQTTPEPSAIPAPARNADGAPSNEIIVTARKRSESDLQVPIAISALGSEQLARYSITKLSDVAAQTPSLNISNNFGSQGGGIALRGISTAPLNAASEQSVALNFDGVTVSQGAAVRFSQFDLERIEVLKGPQSLFFGKNTTAGIISVISANPTKEFYAMGRVGYEFNANELMTEGVISGPIAGDVLTGRLAFYRSDINGWLKNPLANTNAVPSAASSALFGPLQRPNFRTTPNNTDWAVRATLEFTPSADLTIRLKGTYGKRAGSASNQGAQLAFCASGIPAPGNPGNVPGIGRCGLNNDFSAPVGASPTAAQTGEPLFRDGQPYEKDRQYLLVGDIQWSISDAMSLNSVTGYYDLDFQDSANATFSPYPGIAAANDIKRRDFSQEVRLASDFDAPLNFTLGGFYNNGRFYQNIPVTISLFGPTTLVPGSKYTIPNEVVSAFANVTYALFDKTLTLSAGGRYTWERKRVTVTNQVTNVDFTQLARNERTFKVFNPELNISWTPTRRMTVYATYKRGAKSGGFNADTLNALSPGIDISYDDESVHGIEGGLKSVLADGALRLDLAAFSYTYKNLQVGNFDPRTAVATISNAGSAKLEGIELSANYSPPVLQGLSFSATINYDRARYQRYLGPCYIGQTFALGCRFSAAQTPADGVNVIGVLQDFAGRTLSRAPKWSGSVNATYEKAFMADGTSVGLSLGGVFTDSFYPMTPQPPQSLQRPVLLVNSQVRLFNDDRGWEIALIGKNLTDKRRVQLGVEAPFTPGPFVASGTGTRGTSNLADQVGFTNRPLEVMLRLTVKSSLFK